MIDETDLTNLAHELAEVACATADAETGRRLMRTVHRLMTKAGLPTDDCTEGEVPDPSSKRMAHTTN